MNLSLAFVRILFFILSVLLVTTYMVTEPTQTVNHNLLWGIFYGAILGVVLIGFDLLFRRFNLRSFNIAILGIFIGFLMGKALLLVFNAVVDIGSLHFEPHVLEITKISLFLFGTYLGTIMTLKTSNELYVSIPFVRFAPTTHKKKDLLIDPSALSDTRLIDLVNTGLFNRQLIIPRFLIKELYAQTEIGDEGSQSKAKKSLDVIKKLELTPNLDIRFSENDFPDIKDLQSKFIRLARLLDSNILSADLSKIQTSSLEGILIINLHTLSNALKPLNQTGEFIRIKVQRHGKEPRQGVGYLEDGTMVVINGGGKFLGETIDTRVLSVKHTSSGRMIFCNACDDSETSDDYDQEAPDE